MSPPAGRLMANRTHVLIVVPCLNEAATLRGLIGQLVTENPGALIVVADGGSSDGSREIVAAFADRTPDVRLLDNPGRLQSIGINLAVRRFGEGRDWLVRIDAHCGYPADYVGLLLAAAARHAATGVVVPMVTTGQGCFQKAAAAAQNSLLGTGGAAHRHVARGPLANGGFVDHGHHALFSLKHFVAVGGYDESFSHNEDAELDVRLLRSGAKLWLEPAAALVYFPRRTPARLWAQYRGYGQGRARTTAKHGLKLKPRQWLPLLVAPAVLLAVAGSALAVAGSAAIGLLFVLPALLWAVSCLGYGLMLGARARSLCAGASGLAAMVMHLGWSTGYWQGWLGPHFGGSDRARR